VKKAQECRKNAEECRTLAILARTEEFRIEMIELAAVWERLAADHEIVESLRKKVTK